jgi:hypothetical protein
MRRLSIGFKGGQSISVRIEEEAESGLRKALPGGGWHDLKTEDGEVTVDLSTVIYLQADSDGSRLGFSA